MRVISAVLLSLFIVFAASCGDEAGTGSTPNPTPMDAGFDVGEPDPTCVDQMMNGDETDVDCGGSCGPCADGGTCSVDTDCESANCPDGTCQSLTGLGEPCTVSEECTSGLCREYGDVSYCSEPCDGMCDGMGLACYDGFCTPSDYCENANGVGDGPGCQGTVCDTCAELATCVERAAGFTCDCPAGYDDTNGDGTVCADIDECATGGSDCDSNATCTNTDGGFTCACGPGYDDTLGDGTVCTDLNECSTGTDNCDPVADCTNRAGGFSCTCPTGYNDTSGDGSVCTDIDECATGANNCASATACNNTPGSYVCGCPPGFTDVNGDGTVCTDINECNAGTDNCSADAACSNTNGGFTCTCDAGFSGDGVTCADANECTNGTNNCAANGICTNEPGGFSCSCPLGFNNINGDGTVCLDIDECTSGANNCDTNASCSNNLGGFTCACDPGFTGNGTSCTDVNECSQGLDNCATIANCFNTPGSFTCTCPGGYTGDGTSCTDINECGAFGVNNCSSNATCTNTAGSFTCSCAPGYYGNGLTCRRATSCRDLHINLGVNASGIYTIDADGGGSAPAVNAYCDMTTDGGGYTMYKVDYGSAANAVQAESYCAARGMQLFIPRTQAHRNSALAVARSGTIGPSGSANYMYILGIYPRFNGARCVGVAMNSGSCSNWRASDSQRYFVSTRTNISEPNGDNTTNSSMYYTWQSNNEVSWYNDIVSPGYTSRYFMCDVGDKF